MSQTLKYILAVVVIIALLSTILLYVKTHTTGLVGVLYVRGYIISESDRDFYLKAVEESLKNDSIKAVVVKINSGGGVAQLCEEIYGALKRLAGKKPVITYVDGLAASGGYMIALAGEKIYASPSSFVGNVGVIAFPPPIVLPSEAIIELSLIHI